MTVTIDVSSNGDGAWKAKGKSKSKVNTGDGFAEVVGKQNDLHTPGQEDGGAEAMDYQQVMSLVAKEVREAKACVLVRVAGIVECAQEDVCQHDGFPGHLDRANPEATTTAAMVGKGSPTAVCRRTDVDLIGIMAPRPTADAVKIRVIGEKKYAELEDMWGKPPIIAFVAWAGQASPSGSARCWMHGLVVRMRGRSPAVGRVMNALLQPPLNQQPPRIVDRRRRRRRRRRTRRMSGMSMGAQGGKGETPAKKRKADVSDLAPPTGHDFVNTKAQEASSAMPEPPPSPRALGRRTIRITTRSRRRSRQIRHRLCKSEPRSEVGRSANPVGVGASGPVRNPVYWAGVLGGASSSGHMGRHPRVVHRSDAFQTNVLCGRGPDEGYHYLGPRKTPPQSVLFGSTGSTRLRLVGAESHSIAPKCGLRCRGRPAPRSCAPSELTCSSCHSSSQGSSELTSKVYKGSIVEIRTRAQCEREMGPGLGRRHDAEPLRPPPAADGRPEVVLHAWLQIGPVARPGAEQLTSTALRRSNIVFRSWMI